MAERGQPRSREARSVGRGIFAAVVSAALLLSFSVQSASASCIWFSDGGSIKQVNTDSNSVTASARLHDARRLMMNASDCSVWALHRNEKRLIKFDASAQEVRNVRLRELDRRLHEVERIRLDPYDDTLWVAGERRLFHLDAEAIEVLGSFRVPGEIRRLRVALDQSLWVLGAKKLWHFDREGKELGSWRLERALRDEARYFALDDVRGAIWIVGRHQAARRWGWRRSSSIYKSLWIGRPRTRSSTSLSRSSESRSAPSATVRPAMRPRLTTPPRVWRQR